MPPLRSLALLLGALPSLLAAESLPLLDKLPQNGVQSAFQILRRDYIRRGDLTFEELNRAALQGLLERLDFGASLQPSASDAAKSAASVHAEFLAPGLAYLRPETFVTGEGVLFEKALEGVVEIKARHLVIDLRSGGQEGLFEEAALMLQCFLPQGELMFKMKQMGREEADLFVSKRAPLWTGAVILLLDQDTSPAAEVMAACLHQHGRALLVGGRTRGATVSYTSVRLDDTTLLRYASAEMLLPDGASFFKKGLEPHFPVSAQRAEKQKVFQGSRGKSMKPFVQDRVRPRFNESALVSGGNPELDAYVRRSLGQPLPGDEGQLRDVVTQRAIDLLRGDDLLSAATLPWDASEASPSDQTAPAGEVIPKAVPAKPAAP